MINNLNKLFKAGYKKLAHFAIDHRLDNYVLVKSAAKGIKTIAKDEIAVVGNNKMYLDKNDSSSLSVYGVKDEFETKYIRENVKPGNIVVDGGANIGYFTLIFAELVGKDGRVYAFEPEPVNFAILKKNVEVNGYRNVILEQKALSSVNSKIRLYLSKEKNTMHRIYDSGESAGSIQVDCVRLDDYIHEKVDFVKLDLEGSEPAAIEGMMNLLSGRPALITEFTPFSIYEFGRDPWQMLELLHRAGYAVSLVHGDRLKQLDIQTIKNLLEEDRRVAWNLICTDNKRLEL